MLLMRSGKQQITDNQIKKKIRTLGEKETYNYLRILEADIIKQVEIREKIKKEYLRETRKLLETKLYSRNLLKRLNKGFSRVKYSGPFLKRTREELQRTREQ